MLNFEHRCRTGRVGVGKCDDTGEKAVRGYAIERPTTKQSDVVPAMRDGEFQVCFGLWPVKPVGPAVVCDDWSRSPRFGTSRSGIALLSTWDSQTTIPSGQGGGTRGTS